MAEKRSPSLSLRARSAQARAEITKADYAAANARHRIAALERELQEAKAEAADWREAVALTAKASRDGYEVMRDRVREGMNHVKRLLLNAESVRKIWRLPVHEPGCDCGDCEARQWLDAAIKAGWLE